MSRRLNENWLLVEWGSGGRDVVYLKSVLSPLNRELKIGEVLTVNRRGEPQGATLIARAKERDLLDPKVNEEAGPSPKPDDEPADYSASGSSWAPSDDAMSADSDKDNSVSAKKIKLDHCKRQYINTRTSKKVPTPSYRANAIIPKCMQDSSKKNDSLKRPHKDINRSGHVNKSLPDSTKRNSNMKSDRRMVTIDVRELEEIGNSFRLLFSMIEELKRPILNVKKDVKIPRLGEEMVVQATEEFEENDEYEHEEEFNRSDDNVLITNKYDNTFNASMAMKERVKVKNNTTEHTEPEHGQEWVPIGSGKTLIHIDQFRKVNWKSYTIATRTLLLAVFPRRILATHSLTGKRSPAFRNKPAKMCLDPKIISDVIMEITDRFDVKENLVRSIITTKCADECKMLKMKTKKKKSTLGNQENEPPSNEFQDTKLAVK